MKFLRLFLILTITAVMSPLEAMQCNRSLLRTYMLARKALIRQQKRGIVVESVALAGATAPVPFIGQAVAAGAAIVTVGFGAKLVFDAIVSCMEGDDNCHEASNNKNEKSNESERRQLNSTGNGNAGGSKKPDDDDKDKKRAQRTKADLNKGMNEIKKDYKFDNSTNSFKLRQDGEPLTCNGKECEYLRKDYQHSEIEAFDKRRKHLGALDPVNFEQVKGPRINRKL